MERMEALTNYYTTHNEDARLTPKRGMVEFLTTIHYVEKYLKPGMRILEIGAGTGRYSHYFAQNGYAVDAVELMECNIEVFKANTKDGVLVLFHDEDLRRVTGQEGKVSDYTYEELKTFNVKKGDIHDKIPTLEDFLDHFAYRDITVAIELKDNDIEKEVADLIFKYGIEKKTVVTAFELERIRKIKEYAPTLRVGYLTNLLNDDVINKLIKIGADEYCPYSQTVTAETVAMLHRLGFNVRAWGISDEATMKQVYDAGADGMTVNFSDKLLQYIAQKNEE